MQENQENDKKCNIFIKIKYILTILNMKYHTYIQNINIRL